MAEVKLPAIRDLKPGASVEDRMQALTDAYAMLTKQLKYLLANLDSGNVTELDADITHIKNLVSETIVTQSIIAQSLYSELGYIAELTVDMLDTSQKVRKYKLRYDADFDSNVEKQAESLSAVNYIKIHEQNIEFITGTVKYDGAMPLDEQAVDRFGKLLYWVPEVPDVPDSYHKTVQYEENDDPVMVYQYNELVKAAITFELNPSTSEYEVRLILGAGFGNVTYPDRGKAFIEKDTDGLILRYIKADGTEVFHRLGEDGNILSHEALSSLRFYSNGFIAEYGDTSVGYRWTKDGEGRITQLENIYTSEVIPVSWNGGAI
jgi:hypothetical protein